MQLEPSEVREIREGLGMQRNELSRRLGMQADAVRAWESGKRKCKGAAAIALIVLRELNRTRAGKALIQAVLVP